MDRGQARPLLATQRLDRIEQEQQADQQSQCIHRADRHRARSLQKRSSKGSLGERRSADGL